jgi:polygalacturonase
MRFNLFLVAVLFTVSSGASARAEKLCDVHTYGATGDGHTKDTAAIQAAIDDCANTGGTVRVAGAPIFISGPLTLQSKITLSIAAGTTLAASSDHVDFPEEQQFGELSRRAFLTAKNAMDVVITGGGVIDGRGDSWWPHREPGYTRPRLIVFDHCKHVRMENITAQNSPMWQIVPYYSDDVVFRNMKVLAPTTSHNTDGIDPFSSSHVVIDHVLIDTGDDNVAIKSGQPNSPGPDAPSTDITITYCTFLNGHGLSIGSEVSGGVQRVSVDRVHFKGTGNGIRIKANRDRGGDIGPLSYSHLDMEDVATAILITEFYPRIPISIDSAPITRLTPRFHDITISHVRARGSKDAVVVVGLPESPILGLQLSDVSIQATKGATLQYVQVGAKNFKVQASAGASIAIGQGVTKIEK